MPQYVRTVGAAVEHLASPDERSARRGCSQIVGRIHAGAIAALLLASFLPLVTTVALIAGARTAGATTGWQVGPLFSNVYFQGLGEGALGSDGRLYFAGGQWYGAIPPTVCSGYAGFAVGVYDPGSSAWSFAAPMQTGRWFFGFATGGDGRLYAIGGRQPGAPQCGQGGADQMSSVEAYTPTTNSWSYVAPMLVARQQEAAVEGADGRIYVFGGTNDSASAASPGLSESEVYDPTTNTWTQIASMPDPRRTPLAGIDRQGRIYVLGGCSGVPSCPTAIDRYTPTTNSWETLNAPVPPDGPIGELGSVAMGPEGRIYVISPTNTGGFYTPVEVYDPVQNVWTTGPSPAFGSGGYGQTAVVAPNGTIYWAGSAEYVNSNWTTVMQYLPPTVQTTTTTISTSTPSVGYGQVASVTATVSGSDGAGSVSFEDGTTPIGGCGSVPLALVGSSYQAECSTSSLPVGQNAITAQYSGDVVSTASSSGTTTVTVAPAPLVITASSASTTYGSAPPTITPSYSGFLNGDSASSLSAPPVCSTAAKSSSPAGSYPSSCAGAANSNYVITYQGGTVTVDPAPLTITASSATMTYGGSPPAIAAKYSGFANGDGVASLTAQPSCSTAATPSSPVGNYPSVCSGATDPNYTISYAAGQVAVGAAPLVISASSASITYGTAPPVVTASYAGFVNGDSAASLTTQPACTSAAGDGSPVGTYTTSCSAATDANYAITYQNGKLTIDPAPLTITASSGSMTYGGVPPAVTAIPSGLVNGEDTTVLGPRLACASTVANTTPAGTYATSCSGGVDANYSITYVAGTITVFPATVTVTASSGSITYGDTPPAITPSSVSGLQNGEAASVLVGLACSTTVSSTSPVGTYATACSGAVDANYHISYVAGSITVVAAPLTITASSPVMTYGAKPPAITASYSGFVNTDDATSLTNQPTCTTSTTSSSPVGSYPSSCAGAAATNYSITYANGTVTVNAAALVITASSGSMNYGDSPPPISPIPSGFQNGEGLSALGSGLTCSTIATSSSPVGSYRTSCSGGADANYAITYDNGTMTVNTTGLVITASTATMTYGGTPPPITAFYAGFVNGESATALTTQPSCSTTATSSSPVGTYASSCSGASDPNYTISYSPGGVVIGAKALVVSASSATMTYGDTPPTITPSYAGFVNGESATALTTQPSCSTTATSSSPVGTYASSCSGASDPNYTISYVHGSVQVTPEPLTITASSASGTYGSTPAAITPSYSGFVNGDSPASLTTQPTCSTTATMSSPVGAYSTTCSGAVGANYTISYSNGTINITAAPLTVAASTASMVYGGATPTITPVVTGLQNGEGASVLGTAILCTTTALATSPIGSYPSSCSGAADTNYAISYVNGTVTVGPAPLSITPAPESFSYGAAPPALTPMVTGLQNGESVSVLGSGLTCSTAANSLSQVGSYDSSCTGAADANYTISYADGTVTLGPVLLTITASSGSMTYGGTAPAVTPTYAGFVNGDSAISLIAQPTCSTTAASSSPVNTYATSCSGAVDHNYAISYAAGTENVEPAPLIIAASSGTMSYGGTVPSVTPAYTGFVNNDSAASLATPPTCSPAATSASPVGTYPTSCSGASDPNYLISYNPGQTVVGGATLVITASSSTTAYGGNVPAVTPTYAGFVNNDSPASLSTAPRCTTTATPSSPVASYSSTCSGAVDANYVITYVPGTVRIGPAPLTITASSSSIIYGQTPPAISPHFSGLVNGEGPSVLGSGLTCSSSALSTSSAGSYPSSCSGAVDTNYLISYVDGSVTVKAATLTVTANNQSMQFGAAVPRLTATISGFVNGQTLGTSGVAGQPQCTTPATSSTPAGTYPITCSIGTLHSTSYTFQFVAGTLTITSTATLVCGFSGNLNVGAGQAVRIAPGCSVTGQIAVSSGGSLDAEGAVIHGGFTFSGTGTLRLCSTNVSGSFTVSGATGPVVIGDGTSSCPGDALGGGVVLTSNSGSVTLRGAVTHGLVDVEHNMGAVTVTDNVVRGDLTVLNNGGTVVDRPNQVSGTAQLQ
jgi:hypothetical protein